MKKPFEWQGKDGNGLRNTGNHGFSRQDRKSVYRSQGSPTQRSAARMDLHTIAVPTSTASCGPALNKQAAVPLQETPRLGEIAVVSVGRLPNHHSGGPLLLTISSDQLVHTGLYNGKFRIKAAVAQVVPISDLTAVSVHHLHTGVAPFSVKT